MVCGLNVTVLCGLGELELEAFGGGRRGDDSAAAEAITGMSGVFLTRFTGILSWIYAILWILGNC